MTLDTEVASDADRGIELEPVALAVIDRERVEVELLRAGNSGGGRRIESAGEQEYGRFGRIRRFRRRRVSGFHLLMLAELGF